MMNGSFSRNAVPNVLRDRILLKGYQSKISRTKGRETAIGLLNKDRIKNPMVKKYYLVENRDTEILCTISLFAKFTHLVYMVILSKKNKAQRRSFLSATHATDSTCKG